MITLNSHKVTLVDQVESSILDYIKSKGLRTGDPIPNESDLVQALGVGRSVVREALSRLRMLEIIETRTRRGMVLSEPNIMIGLKKVVNPAFLSEKALFNLLELRIALEIGICDLIVDNLVDQDITTLTEIVRVGKNSSFGEYTPVSEYDFHTKLYQITKNSTIIDFQGIIHPVSMFLKDKFKESFLPINRELLKQGKHISHEDIITSLASRDKDAFRSSMIGHFTPYTEFLSKLD